MLALLKWGQLQSIERQRFSIDGVEFDTDPDDGTENSNSSSAAKVNNVNTNLSKEV